MRRSGWSLRTRLLLLQITVTAVFLVIMGAVSTVVFARSLGSELDQEVLSTVAGLSCTTSTLTLSQGAAVKVAMPGFAITPLTPPSPETSALRNGVLALGQRRLLRDARPGVAFPVPGKTGKVLFRAAARACPSAAAPSTILVVAEPLTLAGTRLRPQLLAELVTGAALMLLLAIGGQWLIGQGLDPLDKMARTANDITTRGDLTERMAQADDQTEVGRLAAAINHMLDRIQQAFGARLRSERKVREFAADASHELRTPLTTIRGYAELYRQGALGPEQLPSAMRRIEQEARRMSTLVAELLELARLDRTSSLDLAETDLAAVVRDTVADALAVQPGRPITAQAPPRLIATVDEARIRQVLANLLGNVRAHTDPSVPAAVKLGEVKGGVMIEVADAGPGMSAQDAARAFDRFHRAARDDAQGAGAEDGNGGYQEYADGAGSGLGLSIVQAIAMAHGGQATLESWPGHGTRVRIWLPARPASGTPSS